MPLSLRPDTWARALLRDTCARLVSTRPLLVTAPRIWPPPQTVWVAPGGLGQISGLLPRDHLTLESAIQVNLSKETVRLPLYPGTAYAGTPHAEKVWYVLLDASDPGLAHDLGVNYAPKLANIAIGCPACVPVGSGRSRCGQLHHELSQVNPRSWP